ERQKEGKKYQYSSVVNRDAAGVVAIRKVLRQYFRNDINELIQCVQRIQQEGIEGDRPQRTTPVFAGVSVPTVERDIAIRQLDDTRKTITPQQQAVATSHRG